MLVFDALPTSQDWEVGASVWLPVKWTTENDNQVIGIR